jgi:hypothetical protein
VPVDPAAYEFVSDGLMDFLVDALTAATSSKPIFDDPNDKLKAYLAGDDKHLTSIQVAKLLAAVCFRMHEKARVGMDFGGGQFEDDVKAVKAAAETYALPQQISTDERSILDKSMTTHKEPGPLKQLPTGTELFDMDVKDVGGELRGQLKFKVRAPATQVVAFYQVWMPLYYDKTDRGGSPLTIIERENDHSVISKMGVKMPYPFQDREVVAKCLWEKIGDGEYFVSQTS